MLLSLHIQGQGISNWWLMGYQQPTNFSCNFDSLPISFNSANLNLKFTHTSTNISSTNGQLLFYTNGFKVMNQKFNLMINGDTLTPGPYSINSQNNGLNLSQAVLILPAPSDSSTYYLFSQTIEYLAPDFPSLDIFVSKIDMGLDSGKGKVTQKHISILHDTLLVGKLTACKHANGRDWWLISHRQRSNIFFKFLITASGITGPYTQAIGDSLGYLGYTNQACFSPDGTKYAITTVDSYVNLFDFDRCSGLFSNPHHIIFPVTPWYSGLAFSPSSRFLYVSNLIYLYQFDMFDTTLNKNLIAQWDTFYSPNPPFATDFYLMQLASNGKIYMNSTNGVKHLHIINYPDSTGTACGVCQHCITLPAFNASSIPDFPNYFLGADNGSVCDTLMLSNPPPQTYERGASSLWIYPNPVQNYFDINYHIPATEAAQFILYNSIGMESQRIKLLGNTKTQRVNTNDLKNGIYFYKFNNQSGKIVIMK